MQTMQCRFVELDYLVEDIYCYSEYIYIYIYIYNLHGNSLARRGGLDPARFSAPLTEPPLRFRTGN